MTLPRAGPKFSMVAFFASCGFLPDLGIFRCFGQFVGFVVLAHVLVALAGEGGILDQVRKHGRGRQPLDAIDPGGVAGEIGAVDFSAAPDHAGDGVFPFGREDVAAGVEPVFQRRLRLGGVAHDAGVAHFLIAERFAEINQSGPALHGFGGRFLVFSAGRTCAAGPGMASPQIERAA